MTRRHIFVGVLPGWAIIMRVAAAATSYLLMETGDYLLLEDGSKIILE